jgi:hypothetical protein
VYHEDIVTVNTVDNKNSKCNDISDENSTTKETEVQRTDTDPVALSDVMSSAHSNGKPADEQNNDTTLF